MSDDANSEMIRMSDIIAQQERELAACRAKLAALKASRETPTAAPKTCQCSAHNSDECVCGAWDDLDPYKLRAELKACRAELAATKLVLAQNGKDADELAKQLAAVTRERDESLADIQSVIGPAQLFIGSEYRNIGVVQAAISHGETMREWWQAEREKTTDLRAKLAAAEAALEKAEREVARLREALSELVAMVRGECPSLLNEDSGGDATLALKIDAALAAGGGREGEGKNG